MATLFQRPQSILLNSSPSPSPPRFPLSLPSSPYSFPTALSASSSSSENDEEIPPQRQERSSSVPVNSRRIRFAPLPLPDPVSDSLHLASEPDLRQLPPISTSSQKLVPTNVTQNSVTPPMEQVVQSPTASEKTPLAPVKNSQPPSYFPSPPVMKKQSSSISKRLFKPLISWNKSSSTGDDNNSLCRVSSRESTQSAGGRPHSRPEALEDHFPPLSLWSSIGSVSSYASDSGHALSRRPKPSSGTSKPVPRTTASPKHPSAKPGIYMLNGRIYGRKRPFAQSSTNPFANVSSQEPEFVEWGYGGMGSNKASEHSGVGRRWKIVQGDGNTSAFGGARSSAGEDEDASGMAWVKKRRQERERQQREIEEKEKETEETGIDNFLPADSSLLPSTDEEQSTGDEPKEEEKTPKSHLRTLPSTESNQSRPTSVVQDSPEHIYRAISLPPATHKQHHHHPHTHKRDLSGYRSPIIQTPCEEPNGLGMAGVLDMDLGSIIADDSVTEDGVKIDQVRQTRDRGDSSGSTSEEEDSPLTDESEDEDSDSDVDSEGEEATRKRKTALGAGVELLSRHKDHQETRISSIATTSVIKDSASSSA